MTEEFRYVRTGWSMGSSSMNIQVHVDSKDAEEFTEGQWLSMSIEVEKHMKAIYDFLSSEIWPELEAER